MCSAVQRQAARTTTAAPTKNSKQIHPLKKALRSVIFTEIRTVARNNAVHKADNRNQYNNSMGTTPAEQQAHRSDQSSSVQALLHEANTLFASDKAAALARAESALQQAQQHGDSRSEAEAHSMIAKVHGRQSNFAEAIKHYHTALALSELLSNCSLQVELWRALAGCYRMSGQYREALLCVRQGMALWREDTADTVHAADFAVESAIVYTLIGDITTALEYYHTALEAAEPLGNQNRIGRIHAYMGNLYNSCQDYSTALQHFLKSMEIAERTGDKLTLQVALQGIGTVYYGIDDYTKALDYHIRGLSLCREIGTRLGEAHSYSNIGATHFMLRNYPDALKYYLQALHGFRSIGDKPGESRALHNLGLFYDKVGDPDSARIHYTAAYEHAVLANDKEAQASNLYSLGKSAFHAGDTSEAYRYWTRCYEVFRGLELNGNILHRDFQLLLERLAELHAHNGDSAQARRYRTRLNTIRTQYNYEQRNREIRTAAQQHELRSIVAAKNTVPPGALTAADLLRRAQQVDKAAQVPALPTVVVSTFGRFTVRIDNRELTGDNWKRKKTRDVFKVLLLHYRRPVAAEQLMETIWGSAEKTVRNQLWNAISAIRQALEPGIEKKMPSSFLHIEDGCYRLDFGSNSTIDFIEFRTHLAAATAAASAQRTELLTSAIELYTGEFLKEDILEEWTSYERESLREAYIHALMELAAAAVDTGQPDAALRYARKAIEADKLYEEAYELILTTLVDQDQEAEARKVLDQCKKVFIKELGTPPPQRLEALLESA